MDKEKEGKKIISIDLEDDEDKNGEEEEANGNAKTELPSDNGGTTTTTKRGRKMTKAVKDILKYNNTKFMSDFDPELSNREKRKLSRKIEGKKNGAATEENGALSNGIEKDFCDCLNDSCPGCHFPCPKCRSCKCGIECRVNRKWTYESIENESEIADT